MTGIGFVGAGAIIKEGFTVRGLTTAASIWITAAIGILTGIGFYFAAVLGTAARARHAVGVPLDRGAPADRVLRHLHGALRARRGDAEPALRAAGQAEHGFSIHNLSYRLHGDVGAVRVPHGAAHDRRRQRCARCPTR